MIWVISDVHGCFYTLQKLLQKINVRDLTDPKLVFVGDYTDRGNNSKEVVDLVIELQKKGAICLRGNHDDIIDWLLNQQCASNMRDLVVGPITRSAVASWWIANGFRPTLMSYGCISEAPASVDLLVGAFLREVSEEHKKFFRNLSMYWENDTHFACHGYLDPAVELPRELRFLPDELATTTLWNRFAPHVVEEGQFPKTAGIHPQVRPVWNKIGVFGHTPVGAYGYFAPIKHGQIRLIDTEAYDNNYLAAYCCSDDDWLLQATDSRDIVAQK